MANVDFHYPVARTSRFLDVAPLIDALRFQPEDFDLDRGWLSHTPSRHCFQFDRLGRVTIEAQCNCMNLAINPEQKDELISMYKTWRREYWLPIETNREFASHFAKPGAWGRLLRDIRMAFRRFLRREQSLGLPVDDRVTVSATPAE